MIFNHSIINAAKAAERSESVSEMYPLYWTPSKEGTFCVIRLNLS